MPRVSQQLVEHLREKTREAGMTLPPAHIRVDRAPPEHVGLGVGTQLCLAVARAVFRLAGRDGSYRSTTSRDGRAAAAARESACTASSTAG